MTLVSPWMQIPRNPGCEALKIFSLVRDGDGGDIVLCGFLPVAPSLHHNQPRFTGFSTRLHESVVWAHGSVFHRNRQINACGFDSGVFLLRNPDSCYFIVTPCCRENVLKFQMKHSSMCLLCLWICCVIIFIHHLDWS